MSKTFTNIQQKSDSKTCGPNCLLNIYSYLGITTNLESILEDLRISDKDTTHLPQLARHLHKNKLETIILSSNPHNISPAWKDLPKEELISQLKEWIVHHNDSIWLRDAIFLLYYLQEGGQIKIVQLSTELIDHYIHQDYLIVSCLEESWLWEKRKVSGEVKFDDIKGNARGHFVVIYNQSDQTYQVSDPYPTEISNKDGLYSVDKQQLLISTLVWGAQIIAVRKKS